MANRLKRIKRAQQVLQEQQFFKIHFKQNKAESKSDLRPLLKLILSTQKKEALEGQSNAIKHLFVLKLRLQNTHPDAYRIFKQVLQHPKFVFSQLFYYQKLANAFLNTLPCRTLETWKIPKSKNDKVLFKSLFCHLLVKYQIPKCVEAEIFSYAYPTVEDNSFEIQTVFMIADGYGIHRIPYLNLALNGKANFFFHHSPSQLNLVEAITWAKFRHIGLDYSLAVQLAQKLKLDVKQPLCGWHSDLIFFLKRFPDLASNDLKRILDFIIHQKSNGLNITITMQNYKDTILVPPLYPDFQFKGRTVASVLKYVEEWLVYVHLAKENATSGDLPISPIASYRTTKNKYLVTIRQLLNLKDLVKEGKTMGHCVAGYGSKCLDKESSIWSLRQMMPNGKMKNMLTIEVLESNKKINQVRGKFNRNPSPQEVAWVTAWAEKEGLTYQ